ncbi:MAG: hypothetical protein KJ709_03120 [Nanoarchaeota archaeon]|nr:hypothetical protein [Nanoarchaeota archaeon]
MEHDDSHYLLKPDEFLAIKPGEVLIYIPKLQIAKRGVGRMPPLQQIEFRSSKLMDDYWEKEFGVDVTDYFIAFSEEGEEEYQNIRDKIKDPRLRLTVEDVNQGEFDFPWKEWHSEQDRKFSYTGLVLVDMPIPDHMQKFLPNGYHAGIFSREQS